MNNLSKSIFLAHVTSMQNECCNLFQVHELITINNNRVTVDGQSMVLSELHDEFYAKVGFSEHFFQN